ncbi:hypothetical protein LIER_26522 [Lithospermum erythrorhizon]|uniref:Retrovirus-related Pol polyprotein from transposon TNT 1-94 n=1 Tax=Lithospermum erythrorhizon TaxID=34254 RepID=A0AAV3R8W6_LITER
MVEHGYKMTKADHCVFFRNFSDENYVEKVLRHFGMDKAKAVSIPLPSHFKLSRQLCPSTNEEKLSMKNILYSWAVGSLMYAMFCTRPDITHAVGVVSRYLSNPGRHHWEAVKWVMRYLRGSSNLRLTLGCNKPMLVGYMASDLAESLDDRKSTLGHMVTFDGGTVVWQSKMQKCVALSTIEAEFIAAVEATKELLWLRKFTMELDSKLIELEKIHTDGNGADMLTKVLSRGKFEFCRTVTGLILPSN